MCWQIFFFLKDLLVLFIYLFLILNLKIIKNLVGFLEENFFIFFRYLFSCEDVGKFSINLSFFFFLGKFLNLKFVENLVVFSFKKTLWYFMKVLIILSKSRICENMLGILGMTFLCVLENGWKPCRVFVKAVKTLWLFWKHCGALIVWKVFKNLVGFSSISKKDAEIFWKNLFDFSRKSWNFFWNFVEKPFFFFFF